MSKDIPSDGIVVKLARLAVASELKKSGSSSSPLPNLSPSPEKYICSMATGPVKNLEGPVERVTVNGIAEISLPL